MTLLDSLLLPPTDITGAAINILTKLENDSGVDIDKKDVTDNNTLCLDENDTSFDISCGQPDKDDLHIPPSPRKPTLDLDDSQTAFHVLLVNINFNLHSIFQY